MISISRITGQIAAYAVFGSLVGYLSDSPDYTWFPQGMGQVKISFSYGASRKADCIQRTPKELAELPPNMRAPMKCNRERRPLYLEVRIDEDLLYHGWLPPTGLSGDGPSRIYQLFPVATGRHRIRLGLRESARTEGFDFHQEAEIDIRPQQNFVIDFRADQGGFIFK